MFEWISSKIPTNNLFVMSVGLNETITISIILKELKFNRKKMQFLILI